MQSNEKCSIFVLSKATNMIRKILYTYSLCQFVGLSAWAQNLDTMGMEGKYPTGLPMAADVQKNPANCIGGSCDGSVTIFPAGGIPPYTVEWEDGYIGDERTGLCASDYVVSIRDVSGNRINYSFSIDYTETCLWAGDADNDRTVSHFDLLPIALTYGESGYPRTSNELDWMGQDARDWTTVVPIGGLPNYKHIDCDGNGVINQNDLYPIHNNYGSSYNRIAEWQDNQHFTTNIPIGLQDASGERSERIAMPVFLGTPANLATDVYAIAFTVNYDPLYFKAGSEMVDFNDSWLTPDPISIQKVYSESGKIEVAVARKDRMNITGFGNIGTLFLTIRDDVFRTEDENLIPYTPVTISDIRLIDNANNSYGIEPISGTVTIESRTTSTPLVLTDNEQLLVYPNPARQTVFVEMPADAQRLQLHNAAGQVVYEATSFSSSLIQFSSEHLASGIYYLSVQTNTTVLTQKLQVVK